MKQILQNRKYRKALIFILGLLSFAILFYLFLLPMYPEVKYKLSPKMGVDEQKIETEKIVKQLKEKKTIVSDKSKGLPESDYKVSQNRLIISKIGVNAPIVQTDNEEYGLSLGAWLLPSGSKPGQIGNTIITGHRFKYLPPNNLTFYLFHKLEVGDLVYIIWNDKELYYKIDNIKVVDNTDASVIASSDKEILTLFTCTPIYSTKKRLVVTAKPFEE